MGAHLLATLADHPGDETMGPKDRAEEDLLGAVSLVFRAELRRRWQSWLPVAVLISVAGGLAMAAAAAGRRTESAFPRFVAAHGFDAVVYATKPVPKIGSCQFRLSRSRREQRWHHCQAVGGDAIPFALVPFATPERSSARQEGARGLAGRPARRWWPVFQPPGLGDLRAGTPRPRLSLQVQVRTYTGGGRYPDPF
jgi:hypothetical protein